MLHLPVVHGTSLSLRYSKFGVNNDMGKRGNGKEKGYNNFGGLIFEAEYLNDGKTIIGK